MKNIILKPLTIFLIVIAFESCKKDDKTKTELLTEHDWVLNSAIVNPPFPYGGTLITNLYEQYPACYKDDIYNFAENGTYLIDEGASKCNTGDPQVHETGTWTFNADETIIHFSSNAGSYEWSVNELNSSILKSIYTESTGSVTYSYTVTFGKK